MSIQFSLGEFIIQKSTGIFGDFQMPVCAKIISTEGKAQGWGLQITDSDVKRILRRYKEHATFWNSPPQTVLNELALFDNALAEVGLLYQWEYVQQLYAQLPPKRAAPNEFVL